MTGKFWTGLIFPSSTTQKPYRPYLAEKTPFNTEPLYSLTQQTIAVPEPPPLLCRNHNRDPPGPDHAFFF